MLSLRDGRFGDPGPLGAPGHERPIIAGLATADENLELPFAGAANLSFERLQDSKTRLTTYACNSATPAVDHKSTDMAALWRIRGIEFVGKFYKHKMPNMLTRA